jgi:hypothetical protein
LCGACNSTLTHRASLNATRPKVINDYAFNPSKVKLFHAKGQSAKPDTQYLGVEIEVDNGGEKPENVQAAGLYPSELYYVKHDGSLHKGFEVVSMPATYQYWIDEADFEWAHKLKQMDYRSYDTDTCGMHVHVSRASVSYLTIYKLLKFMSMNKDFILKMSRRQDQDRLARYSGIDRGKSDSRIYGAGAGGRFIDRVGKKHPAYRPKIGSLVVEAVSQNDHSNRYKALNLENEKTIEFRIFRGTLDVPAIKRNLAFVVALCAFMKYSSLRIFDEKNAAKRKDSSKLQSLVEFLRYLKSAAAISTLGKEQAADLLKWCVSKIPADKQHD